MCKKKKASQGCTSVCVCVVLLACTSKRACWGQVWDVWNSCGHTKDCFLSPIEGCMPKLVRDVDGRQRWEYVAMCVWVCECLCVFSVCMPRAQWASGDRFLHLISFLQQFKAEHLRAEPISSCLLPYSCFWLISALVPDNSCSFVLIST